MISSMLNKIISKFNFSNSNSQNFIKDSEIHKAIELVKEKIIINKDDPDSNKIANDVLQRLIDSNNLKKAADGKFLKKITKAINSIEAFGSIPQAYKENPKLKRGEDIKNFVKFLYTNIGISSEIISIDLVKALLFKKNKKFLHEVLGEFQRVAHIVIEELNSRKSITPPEQMLTEIFIGNLLAITPFLEPDPGQIVSFPQFINGKWESVSYKIERLQLTPDELGDPLYAYGLVPIQNKSAPPLLLFMGTPPPTTTGVKLAEWVDLPPGYAVGEIAFDYAEDTLVEWINRANQQSDYKVQLYGQSLGGSLSIICASSHPDKIGKIFAYNPPSPTPQILNRFKTNVKGITPPQINVYHQKNDLVPYVGTGWDNTWNVFRVIPEKKNPLFYFSHIQGFTGQENVLIHKIDVAKDKISKTRLNLNKIFEVVRKPIFALKTATLKWSIITRDHSFFSFISRVSAIGIGHLFGMLFSTPQQDQKGCYIQNLLNEVKEWRKIV